MKTHASIRGAALVVAMLIAALAATIVAGLLWQQQIWLRQHSLAADQTQARTLALAGINWARAILQDDAKKSYADHLGEYWAIRLPSTPLENGDISGYISDQQALFNLNNMVQSGLPAPLEIDKFRRLLARLNLPATLADSVLDWIDNDAQVTSPGGGEEGYYRALSPPAWPANRPLTRIAELSATKTIDAAALARLAPFISALPASASRTPVNINTASAEVLSAIITNLSLERAAAIAAERRNFGSVAEFKSKLPTDAFIADGEIDVRSRYFLISVTARIGSSRGFARALVQRDATAWPIIVWQVVE